MRASQDLGRLARPKIQPVVKLCLCKSYSVLTACIASSLQNQTDPVFSQANSGHAHTEQFHPNGTLLYGHMALSDASPD